MKRLQTPGFAMRVRIGHDEALCGMVLRSTFARCLGVMKTESESATPPRAWWQVWRWEFHWQVLLAVAIGATIGLLWARMTVMLEGEAWKGSSVVAVTSFMLQVVKLVGDLFLSGLKLVIVPLVVTSLALSVAGLGGKVGFGRMAGVTIAFFMSSSLFAVLVGLVCVNTIRPGDSGQEEPLLNSARVAQLEQELEAEGSKVKTSSGAASSSDLLSVFRSMVPSNPVQAASETNLLGLITIAILIGLFTPKLAAHHSQLMTDFLQAVHDLTMLITNAILKTAPIGVGCLMIATLAEQGAKFLREDKADSLLVLLQALGWFVAAVVIGLVIHVTIVLPTILILFGRVNPLKHYRAMLPAMLTAFSTSSSNATLPVTIECVERNVGVSRRTTSFVCPLGATVNMDGTALYECVAAMFVVQLFGIDLTFGEQFLVVMVALLTSIGVAGVPSASLVAIIIILQSLDKQLADRGIEVSLLTGLALILVFDRVLDMGRTVVNILSDSCAAVVVARSMGESGFYAGSKDPL